MAVSFEMRLGIVAEDDCRQPKCCGAFCKTHTPQNLKLTYLAIEKALGKIATSNGSAASVSSRDMVIAVHCKGGFSGAQRVEFYNCCGASSSRRRGSSKLQQQQHWYPAAARERSAGTRS